MNNVAYWAYHWLRSEFANLALTSIIRRKLVFCICKNKGTDQLRGNHTADQRLCFDSPISLLPRSEISSLVAVQPGLSILVGNPKDRLSHDTFHMEIFLWWWHLCCIFEPRHEKTGFFCKCRNKDADQLCDNREADQRLCFRYTDSTIPLLPKSEISSF